MKRLIFICFTVTEILFASLIVWSLYQRMQTQYMAGLSEEAEIIADKTARSIELWLQRVIKLSDSLYYGVIKNADLSDPVTMEKASVLYESEKELVTNIGVLSEEGELLLAAPPARLSSRTGYADGKYFREALERPEALVFSMPHVQRIFEGAGGGQYRWGLTFSRAVEISDRSSVRQGVLIIELLYSGLQQYLEQVSSGVSYVYLINRDGEILYHPRMQLIASGIEEESTEAAARHPDGSYEERFNGELRTVTVKTVGYTGWKVAAVSSSRGFYLNNRKNLLFAAFLGGTLALLLALVNSFISSRITEPIHRLEQSVELLESGDLSAEIYVGGAPEIRHLGGSIARMSGQIRELMQDIVDEHETRRKTEFEALQSQINPHFLYNTLDIIVWMIENEQKDKAAQMVTALGRFFRLSLSRGKSIIPAGDEVEHVRNYLLIQHSRFKNKFTYRIEEDDAVKNLQSVKLILQPIVENAIYHGMEFMDGDGEILVKAEKDGDTLVFTVQDNGLGMTEETCRRVLSGAGHTPSRRGSGIGVRNVDERIRIYYGEDYGVSIASEPDEGTTVTIRMPALPYEEEALG